MILSDKTLYRMLEAGTLSITPLEKEQVQPASVDIRLGNTFSIVEDLSTGILTLKDEVRYKTIKMCIRDSPCIYRNHSSAPPMGMPCWPPWAPAV